MTTQAPQGIEAFYAGVTNVSDFIWGGSWNGEALIPFPPMVIVLLGVGAWIMIGLRFYPILKLGEAFAGLFKKEKSGHGEISPFAALSTALSGQVGTGNLAGVATAITLGGPGALFWMWVTALFGMALAFAEGSLAIRFREQREDGTYQGGPMSYIRRGLGKKWGWLAVVFCIGLLFSSIAIGSDRLIPFDPLAVRDRLSQAYSRQYYADGHLDVTGALAPLLAEDPVRHGPGTDRTGLVDVNRDLFPQDEFRRPYRGPAIDTLAPR